MRLSPARLLVALLVSILLGFLLLLALVFTDTLLNIWRNLQEAPDWLVIFIFSLLGFLSLFSGWAIVRLLRPKGSGGKDQAQQPAPTEETLDARLTAARSQDIDVSSAERELELLRRRRAAGVVHVALFGDISSGKSSLVKALLPGSRPVIDVAGGTTHSLVEYSWASPAGDQLVITDMPGMDEVHGDKDRLSQEEALRAHLVVYVCEGDLTRSQYQELQTLGNLNKPVILALNKIDRLQPAELEQVLSQLRRRVATTGVMDVVGISTGARQPAVRILPDGSEETFQRDLPAQVTSLQRAIQRIIDGNSATLEQLRDSAVFVLANRRLDEAVSIQRRVEADKLVSSYTKKAVVGAIAAMTPGTDILIQGFLASQMVKELSKLYDVPIRKVDIDLLLELIQQHVRTHITLILAIAGNALKAFPGAGTLAGGVLHAVAYGFLFESMGKSITLSLESRGEIHPLQIADQFEESLGENIKASAGRYARMAIKEIARGG